MDASVIIPATSASIYYTHETRPDNKGNLYLADAYNNRIRKIDKATGLVTTVARIGQNGYNGDDIPATSAKISAGEDIVFDSLGNLYLADIQNNRVRKIDKTSGNISTVAGNGSGVYQGDNIPATSASIAVNGLAIDKDDNLYVGSSGLGRYWQINKASGLLITVAGSVAYTFSGDGGQATAAGLSHPWGISFDSTGNMYLCDVGNSRVRKVNK